MATPDVARECECLDEVQTPLNACSLELCGSALVVGCYQLEEASQGEQTASASASASASIGDAAQVNESTSRKGEDDGDCKGDRDDIATDGQGKAPDNSASQATRSGELRLYSIPLSSSCSAPSPKFGDPVQVLPMESGVLDSKWCPSIPRHRHLASACASGRIHIHELKKSEQLSEGEDENNIGRFRHVSSSALQDEDVGNTRLALSLDWEKRCANGGSSDDDDDASRKIVSSYSDGSISIHSFHPAQEGASLVEEERWDAHTLFGCPSEVWTCCFAASTSTGQSALSNDGTNVVISGGDDCTMKLWDVRSGLFQPLAKVGNAEFEAGVTALSYHPTIDHIFAVGSYDEVVRFYDVRSLKNPLGRVNVGGGVWRIRWHPNIGRRMLVGAMHGGCRIVNADNFADPRIKSQFTKHESMAYGADWLIGEMEGEFDGESSSHAASCSFYDRRVCLWRDNALRA